MKKQFILYFMLLILLFTACARANFKGAEKELVTHTNANNIFN